MVIIDMDYRMTFNLEEDLHILRGLEKTRDKIQAKNNGDIKMELYVWTPTYKMTEGMVYTYNVRLEGDKNKVFENVLGLINNVEVPQCFHRESDSDLVKELLKPYGKKTRRFFSLSDNRLRVIDAK